MLQNKTQVIYKLEGIDAEDGVDIFEIAPILMQFGELVKVSNEVLGFDQTVSVKVKPFKEGSWITEFVLNSTIPNTILNHLKNPEGQDLLMLMAFLGFGVKDGVTGVVNIIRRTKGNVDKFKKKSDEEIEYEQPDGSTFSVTTQEHKLVQSVLVQANLYNAVISPLDKFPMTTAVGITTGPNTENMQKITDEDKDSFTRYSQTELLEDVEDNIGELKGVFVKPKRGSYSGEEKAYSFIMGENNTLWPVTIEDEEFLEGLRAGEIRPYAQDVLKVNLEIRQKRDVNNKVVTHYTLTKVIDYIKYEKPKQLEIGDIKS